MPNRYQLSPLVQKTLKELNLTAEEVIRKALSVKAEGFTTSEGVFFPEGTYLITWYKDVMYQAIIKDGVIAMGGETFTSISGAAAKVTGRPTTNGWSFWMVKLPGKNEVVRIDSFRKT